MRYQLQPAAVEMLIGHCSTGSARPVLNCIFLRGDGVAVATDGLTMAIYQGCAQLPPRRADRSLQGDRADGREGFRGERAHRV
jgi:hypothetical protein